MNNPVRIGVVTTSRADFGIYGSVLAALRNTSDFDVGLIVTGMHLLHSFGLTVTDVEKSGDPVFAKFDGMVDGDTPTDIGLSMGQTTYRAAGVLASLDLDLLMVLGDRYEMHAVALAALPFRIPVVHLHGGEETEGAIDNALRHSMSKLSHLHFCSTELAALRLKAMGENPDHVIVSGAPALDRLDGFAPLSRSVLAERFGIPADRSFALVTFHPETLDPDGSLAAFDTLVDILSDAPEFLVFTAANADTAGRALNARMEQLAGNWPARASFVQHMGSEGYFSAMHHASLMIGNSSSGILEAASFCLPVVNIGSRQAGRERSPNVVDCATDADSMRAAVATARSDAHRQKAKVGSNVYGDGQASAHIIAGLRKFLSIGAPVRKHFYGVGS